MCVHAFVSSGQTEEPMKWILNPLVFHIAKYELNMWPCGGLDFVLTWRAGAHRPLLFDVFISRVEMAGERALIAIFDVLWNIFLYSG